MSMSIQQHKEFSELTVSVTKSLSKQEKKAFGFFVTPVSSIKLLCGSVVDYAKSTGLSPFQNILEPSCGTCEMIKEIDRLCDGATIDAIEYNEKIYREISKPGIFSFKNGVNIIHADFLKYNAEYGKKYDLIIGNPPYFVCGKNQVHPKFAKFISGRPNIFGLFILHSMEMLNDNGILAFIIPRSFLNSAYYSNIRNYIKSTCRIVQIKDHSKDGKFMETEQSTISFIIQKHGGNIIPICDYSMLINGNYIFTDNSAELNELLRDSTTLDKLGLKVRTGQVVWNEHKDILCDDPSQTLLVYNSNLSENNTIEIKTFKNDEKGQYIRREGNTQPTLVVNRGNGNSAYKLNYALICDGRAYLIENHLNEIIPKSEMKKEELFKIYNIITESFKNAKTQRFIDLFLGNNGLSKTELETIFPIYLSDKA